jgi:hypothetical protein
MCFDSAMLGRLARALFVSVAIVGPLALSNCSPDPRNVSCHNDGECRERGGKFNYCLQSRCVECVGNSRCRPGFLCVDGECTLR